MPVVTDYRQVKDIYAEAVERGIGLPVFCCEDRETVEGILSAGLDMSRQLGVECIPLIISATGRYPARNQLQLFTKCGDAMLGANLMLSDLQNFMGPTSPYRKMRILPHLDHAFPWLDADLMEMAPGRFASVMCDASEKPFDENIRLTAGYVGKVRGKVVVEGAVDEIFELGGKTQKNEPAGAQQAVRFLRETGVDILVPNVGTEHRATADKIVYRSDHAREISAAVGKILCLHGTSSLKPEDLPRLPADGFVKINIYTVLAVLAGQAIARTVLKSIGQILPEQELRDLVKNGVLGPAVLSPNYRGGLTLKPILNDTANPQRRDAWVGAVRDKCMEFMRGLGYTRFAR